MLYYAIKLLVSAGLIVAITEIAKRNNYVATIVHSLPLTSLLICSSSSPISVGLLQPVGSKAPSVGFVAKEPRKQKMR